MKEGFWTFLEGTHPRLGAESPVKLLCGQTPAIKMIRDYSLHQPQLCHQLEKLEDQIHNLLVFVLFAGIVKLILYGILSTRLCRVRSLLLEIANIERQPLWAIGELNRVSNLVSASNFYNRCLFFLC